MLRVDGKLPPSDTCEGVGLPTGDAFGEDDALYLLVEPALPPTPQTGRPAAPGGAEVLELALLPPSGGAVPADDPASVSTLASRDGQAPSRGLPPARVLLTGAGKEVTAGLWKLARDGATGAILAGNVWLVLAGDEVRVQGDVHAEVNVSLRVPFFLPLPGNGATTVSGGTSFNQTLTANDVGLGFPLTISEDPAAAASGAVLAALHVVPTLVFAPKDARGGTLQGACRVVDAVGRTAQVVFLAWGVQALVRMGVDAFQTVTVDPGPQVLPVDVSGNLLGFGFSGYDPTVQGAANVTAVGREGGGMVDMALACGAATLWLAGQAARGAANAWNAWRAAPEAS